jgi:hypothetical protein
MKVDLERMGRESEVENNRCLLSMRKGRHGSIHGERLAGKACAETFPSGPGGEAESKGGGSPQAASWKGLGRKGKSKLHS